jgi:glycosyltransferase involved in cell wall biosynthesis
MGKQGRERVEQYYSWRAIAQQTLALYQRLCKSIDVQVCF